MAGGSPFCDPGTLVWFITDPGGTAEAVCAGGGVLAPDPAMGEGIESLVQADRTNVLAVARSKKDLYIMMIWPCNKRLGPGDA